MENKPEDRPPAPQEPDDERSPLAVGYVWAVRITEIGLEMTLPVLLGVWLDRKFGTVVIFVVLGLLLGMGIGLTQLLKIARDGAK